VKVGVGTFQAKPEFDQKGAAADLPRQPLED
jgi:hypothetical protein